MTAQNPIDQLIHRIYDGSEETIDVEYIGRFVVNGLYTLRLPEPGLDHKWQQSIVPFDFFPLYGLKIDQPEKAGGLFDAAPFARFERDDLQNQYLNLPAEPEPLYELCTDNCGAQFWVGESLTVYGHNLDNQFQPIGPLTSFVDFAVHTALQKQCWHRCLRDSELMAKYELQPITMMG